MQCPDKGTWQAFLDDEVTATEKKSLKIHLESCLCCKKVINELQELENWCDPPMAEYQSVIEDMVTEDNKNKSKPNNQPTGGILKMGKAKKWVAVAASAVVLTGTMAFAPVQDAVADFLSIFRVQKIETVKINTEELNKMAQAFENKLGEVDLQQLGKMEIVEQIDQQMLPLAEVKENLSFKFKQPSFVPEGYEMDEKVQLVNNGKAEFSLDVQQVNAVLKGLGANTFLPQSLQGKSFSINSQNGAVSKYLKQGSQQHFSFTQYASPEVTVPEGVNPVDLRKALLDLPLLPNDLRTQLAAIEDWQSTMIIPEAEGVEDITINGNDGVYVENHNFAYMMWVDDGIIYTVSGRNIDRETAIKIAQSI
ncbi:MAG: DUF4367 domain-containing protein [Firmicutes bacterium]|nr:DUF4367 domain-containing protein [Bacillota bacterium]